MKKILEAPCICCGYNGSGYWQKETHNYYCPFYDVGGVKDRAEKIKKILTGYRETKLPKSWTAQPNRSGVFMSKEFIEDVRERYNKFMPTLYLEVGVNKQKLAIPPAIARNIPNM